MLLSPTQLGENYRVADFSRRIEDERALALDPSYGNAYGARGPTYLFLGEFEKSIESFDKALRLTRAINIWLGPKAADYFMLGQYDQAIDWARRTIAVSPDYPLPYFDLIAALALAGNEAEAREELQHYLATAASDPKWPKTIAAWKKFSAPLTLMSTSPGYLEIFDRYFDGLRKAGMPEG